MLGFDSHCHLHFHDFDKDLTEVVARSATAGISHILIPSTDVKTSERSADIAEKYSLYSAAAFHPDHLPDDSTADEDWSSLKSVLLRPRTIAIGETGLDFYHNTFKPEKQIFWFRRHIQLAESLGYPLIVHSRDAESEVLDHLPEKPPVPVILHCWSGDQRLTDIAVSRGYYIGVDGPVTYKKNGDLRSVVSSVPRKQLLVETDSPFLPPEPFRGRRNEPANTRLVVMKIRELQGGSESIESTSFTLWENTMRAYRLHPENRRADVVYRYGDSLYVNVTSKCQNSCVFCIRNTEDGIADYNLRYIQDPPDELVLSTIREFPIEKFKELVFCGFGEPTLRSQLIMKASAAARARGVRTRLNTNGLCTFFMSDDRVLELLGSFDSVSISLNASGAREYNRICPSEVENSWEHLMRFIRLAGRSHIETQLSAVKNSGADIQRVTALAKRLQMPLKVR